MTITCDLSGKRALITGGGSGIGLAIATSLRAAGAEVTLTGRSEDRLARSAKQIGAEYAVLDVTSAGAATGVIADLGPLDICVVNAGIAEGASTAKTSDELWRRIMATNLDGAFYTLRAALTQMDRTRYGRIIAISSIAGLRGLKGASAYTASKHGLIGLVRAVSEELIGSQITCNALCPGYVDTDIVSGNATAIAARTGLSEAAATQAMAEANRHKRLLDATEVAQTALWLISEGAASINGQCLEIAGGQV